MFSSFQGELLLSQKQSVSKFHEEGTTKIYKVVANEKENLVYEVVFDLVDNEAFCSCHKFEFNGILCRHILALFVKKNRVHHLPQHYILQRWTINAKSHVANEISSTLMSEVLEQEGIKSSSTFTKHSLMIEVLKVVEEGQKSQKKHAHLALALHKVHSELLAMGEEEEDNEDINIDGDLGSAPLLEGGTQLLSNITFTLHDPPHVASKGRSKSLRQKHPMENLSRKKKEVDNVGGTSSSPTILNASTNQALHEASLDFNSPIIVSQDPRHSTFMDLMMEATYTSSF
ncbi:hypothetical protein RHGRI_029956 [Rhododendron griersonianum]|uniref:Protein FAR1-RELATED SEQUENCE n=1 Tax=Rhododendron griersonianum TaxID=479676 RepID=A0AAV6INC4_9ERIC|nr:hypothetical protein RHGRI_029956 [Rhododendron griersonianum]